MGTDPMVLQPKNNFALLAAWLVAVCLLPRARADEPHPIAGPENCHLHPALQISLFAREPDVVDPVALTFDEAGRAYVVEMRDYPYGFGADRKPGGTIRLLEDLDGDGKADRSVLFADRLSFPTSIAPWNGGVLVTAPPEIVFLKDTDGDGKADVREVIVKGFTLAVTDSNVNGLRWGLDNRLHGVNGGNGGTVSSPRNSRPAISLQNVDFSFDPATGDLAPTFHTSGGFGLVFDQTGRSFVTYNINHIQQRIIPVRYLNRFPGALPVVATVSISDHGDMARIYPLSEPETRVNHPEQSGYFSSAGGMGFVGVSGYGGVFESSILVCDVVGNLVHRDWLTTFGPVATAHRPEEEKEKEFLASRDKAFRPVGIELGPDGALYLLDMQRDVIEHPDYIPDKVKTNLNLRAGEDRGRIYRLTPKGRNPVLKGDLRTTPAVELVKHLGHSNQWWRGTAQRLLVERQDKAAVPGLKKLLASKNPLARLHALWTLRGLETLSEPQIAAALTDSYPGVRVNALLLADSFLPRSEKLQARVLRMGQNDSSAAVRLQVALTIGDLQHPGKQGVLRNILRLDHQHRWTRLAVLSSLSRGETGMLQYFLTERRVHPETNESKSELLRELADLAAARSGNNNNVGTILRTLVEHHPEERWQLPVLHGLETGLERSGARPKAGAEVASTLEKIARSPALVAMSWKLSRALGLPETAEQRRLLRRATETVLDPSRPVPERAAEISLLALGDYPTAGPALLSLLGVTQPSALQTAALEALRQFRDPALGRDLVTHWRALAPGIRPPTVNFLLDRVPFHEALVAAIETEKIKLGELNLDLEQRRRLLRESTDDIKQRAAKFIGDEEYSNRKTVVEDWLKKLPVSGDAGRGREVFEKICAQCHALAGLGYQVGPDLGAWRHRSVEDLLSNILDPNMAINPSYISSTVENVAGDIETGILQAESGDSIVLLQALARKLVLPRTQVKRLESSGLSLMPEGLEAGMAPADLRDLIAFIQNGR